MSGGSHDTEASAHQGNDLATVRRLEAVSFRSFPSTTLHFDGTWAIRLTAGHPAKRLNSVSPLDPLDDSDLERRLETAARRFAAYGRDLTFRQTPLMPKALDALLDRRGWIRFEESLVMAAKLDETHLATGVDRVPLKDTGRWVDHFLALSAEGRQGKAGMVEVISSIEPKTGLFVIEKPDGLPVSVVRCVKDGTLAGVFELQTALAQQRRGHGEAILTSALRWAWLDGARAAWLQVVADNEPAISLYERFGFTPVYRYVYRRAPS